MNPKLVTIGMVAALAVLMVGTLAVGNHNAFARDHHNHQGDQFNVNNQDSDQKCNGDHANNGCNQNNAQNINGDNIQLGNDNDN